MGAFNTLLDWKVLASGRRRLNEPLMYILDTDLANQLGLESVTAQEGFVTDGASIPRPLWSIVGSPLTGKYTRAAVVHDWLCENKVCSRKLGDKIFLRAMKDDKVNWFKRYTIYWGVRAYAVVTGKK